MNPIKKLAGQTAIYGLSTIIGRFLNYLLVPLYVWYFNPDEYGVVTEFYAYVTFLNILLTYGMETTFFKFAQNKEEKERIFSTILISIIATTSIFLTAVLLFNRDIASAMNYSQHAEYIKWFAIILSLDTIAAIPFAKLRIENKAYKFAAIKLLNVMSNIILTVFFIVICSKVNEKSPDSFIGRLYNKEIGVGYIFISNLISSVITILIFLPGIIKSKFQFDKKRYKDLLIYSMPLLIAGFAGNINDSIDRILMKYFLPAGSNQMHELGIYGANTKLAVVMILFIQMYRFAAEPFFFNYEKEKDSKTVFADITKYFTIFTLGIFLSVVLYIDFFKYFIPNELYWEGLKVVPLALLANLFLGLYFNVSMWYKLSSRTDFGAKVTIISAVLTIVLNIIFIGAMGYMACAWARLIGYLAMVVISYIFGQKYYPIKYDLRAIFLYFGLALLLYGISVLTRLDSILLNILKNTALLLIFIIFAIVKEKIYLRYAKRKSS